MMIEIRGTQFVNKGAELMLRAILEKIEEFRPEAEVCLQVNTNTTKENITSINAYQRMNPRKNILDFNGLSYFIPKFIRRFIKVKYNRVFEVDIDVIMDASGFAYGDQWSSLVLRQVSQDVLRFKKKHKSYIFLPQALGPFTRGDNIFIAKRVFDNASIVFAREKESFQYVKNISHSELVMQAPDFTNLLQPVLDEHYLPLDGKIAVIPNSKMLSDKNSDTQWRKGYIEFLVKTIHLLQAKGESIFLLNHEGAADEAICLEVNSRLDESIDIIAPNCALQVKAIIGHCKLVVCSRFHGCVSALSQGIPCVATSWSHKYEQLFSEYKQAENLLDVNITNSELDEILFIIMSRSLQVVHERLQASEVFKHQSENMWRIVFKSIANF